MIYDRLAAYYDRIIQPLDRHGLERWRKELLTRLPTGSRVLELGAGTGRNFPLYPRSGTVVATEISCEMLIRAAGRRRQNVDLVQADAQKLPFADSSFDAAVATLVFCSVPRPEAAFAEVIRTVRNRGPVLLLEHVRPRGLVGFVFDGLNVITSNTFEDHFNRRTAQIAAESGLRVVDVKERLGGVINLIVCEVKKQKGRGPFPGSGSPL